MDLQNALNLAATAAIVIGVVVGLFELRQALRARRDQAAVDIVRAVQTQEIRQATARGPVAT